MGCEYACTVEGVASAQRSWIFIKSIRLYLDYYAVQYMFVFYISNILSAFCLQVSLKVETFSHKVYPCEDDFTIYYCVSEIFV